MDALIRCQDGDRHLLTATLTSALLIKQCVRLWRLSQINPVDIPFGLPAKQILICRASSRFFTSCWATIKFQVKFCFCWLPATLVTPGKDDRSFDSTRCPCGHYRHRSACTGASVPRCEKQLSVVAHLCLGCLLPQTSLKCPKTESLPPRWAACTLESQKKASTRGQMTAADLKIQFIIHVRYQSPTFYLNGSD